MGLRCLLGHDFDEPKTERERNEEGNEVVVTVQEVKTCQRCGETQVVSENKEITSIDQLRESTTNETATPDLGTGEQSGVSTTAESEPSSTGEEWHNDELSTGSTETGSDSAESAPTAGAETESSESSAPETPASGDDAVEPADPVDRGVADIIEQAEKDDDMLQSPPEGEAESAADETGTESSTETADEDDVPVHPGQRSAEAEGSDGPDAESDDGVILDDEETAPQADGRRQWEEDASPEELPNQDSTVTEPSAPDGEDAEIIDGSDDLVPEQPATEESGRNPTDQPEQPETAATGTPDAVDDEDAEIMDSGPEAAESVDFESTEGQRASSSETPDATEREETEEGHMPWPDAPGEDEGHDATAPDDEPADIEFGSGLTSSEPDSEPETTTGPDAPPTSDVATEETEPTPDRENGHRTDTDETTDTSANRSAPTSNVDLERSSRDVGMEFVCPECGLSRDVGDSSMRAGDICPECRKGYITEQQKAE